MKIESKNRSFYIFFGCIFFAGMVAFGLMYVWQMKAMWLYSAEYRDGVMIKLVDDFAKGINPFSLDGFNASVPPQVVDSGFLNIYLAVIIQLLGSTSSGAAYLSNFVYLIMIVFVTCRICININKPQTKNDYILVVSEAFLGSLCILCFMQRVVYLIVRPDVFCVLCLLIIIDLFTKTEIKRWYIVFSAFLCAIIIYAKVHYAVILVTIVLFFLFDKEKKKSFLNIVIFGVSGCLFTALFFVIINIIYPTYLSEWIPRIFSMVSDNQEYSSDNTEYVINKFKQVTKLLWAEIIFIFAGGIACIVKIKKCGFHIEKTTLFIILNVIVNMLALTFLGRHRGTELSYFFMMLVPSVIILSIKSLHNTRNSRTIIILLVVGCIYCFFNLKSVYSNSKMIVEKQEGFDKIYSIIGEYSSEEIFLSPYISTYCINNDISNYNYGDSFYLADEGVINKFYDKFPFSEYLLPYAKDIYYQHLSYQDVILEKIRNHDYSIIVIDNLDSIPHMIRDEFNEYLLNYYIEIEEKKGEYGVGVTFSFWIPKDK